MAEGMNMEGKEVRFGIVPSALWGQATSATSNGSVNAMHDSMTPMTGLIYMFNMAVGEVIFGGVGVGLIGMLMYAILAMFLAGLMIGRTPEFLGKKLEVREMIMAVVVVVAPAISSLIFAGIAVAIPAGLSSLNNTGPHGLSEILYAFFSAAGNNGSAFAGLNANTPFYNLTLGFCDAHRTVPDDPSRPRHCGFPCSQKDRASQLRYLSHRKSALYRPAHRGGRHRGGADVLSRPGPRAIP